MSESRPESQIVVAYDFSPSSEHALVRAVELALEAPRHVIHVLFALDPTRAVTYETAEHVQQTILERLTAAFAGRHNAAEVQFYVHARIGRPGPEILRLAVEVGADLILIGSHGRKHRNFLGSVCERVTREAHCPVYVARENSYEHIELEHVTPYEHERHIHKEPHRYSYTNGRVVTRPSDWPIG